MNYVMRKPFFLHMQKQRCTSAPLFSLHHTCDISLFRRELPIFCLFLRLSPYENFQNFLYISLFGISDLPTKIQEFPPLFNHSPYLEKEISLFVFWDVSHVCYIDNTFLLLINPKFEASRNLLCLYLKVCVRPGQKPQRFCQRQDFS